MAVLAAALVTTAGASHSMDRDTLEEHCPDHQDHPNKVEDTEPGSTREVDVDGTTVVLVFSEDGRSVEFQDENGDPIAVDFCLKAGDRAGGQETGTEGHVSWTNRGGQVPQISYVIVYRIVDDGGLPECSDGDDNDGDGFTDFPDDPGCDDGDDPTEAPNPQCSDGVDNDDPEDELADADDPGCHSDGDPTNPDSYDPRDNDETDEGGGLPECSDGDDNDGDGFTDFPEDPGCDDGDDPTEAPNPQCSDGVDNEDPEDELADADDPGCHSDGDPTNPDSYDPRDNDETDEDVGVTLTCRANLLAAALAGNALPNLFEANPPSDPCVAEQDGLLVALSPLLGDGGAGLLNDENQIELTDPSGTQPGFIIVDALWADTDTDGSTASADSGVLLLHVNDGTDDQVIVEVLTSESQTSCDTGTTTSAEVVRLFLGGEEVRIPGEHTVLIDPALFEVIELHLEDAGDGADEGPDNTGAQAADLVGLAGNLTAAVADSETGCG